MACPSCSREVGEGFAFCPHCGASLASTVSSTEERKLVTLLFADVTGSTRLAEELVADRLEGRAALAAGDAELGFDRLRRARATFARLEAAWDRARTELVLADALLEAGRRDEVTEVAGAALATLSNLDAPMELDRAKALVSRAG